MNKKKRDRHESKNNINSFDYPFPAPLILAWLRSALAHQQNCPMTYARLGRMAGQLTNTTHYWFNESLRPHLVGLLRLLEQLPPRKWQELHTNFCRILPALEHPCLAHDLENLSLLFETLKRKSGLTVITGGTDSARSFVLTALGHGFPRLRSSEQQVVGIDLHHQPAEFVPVSSLFYVKAAKDTGATQREVRQAWEALKFADAPLMLFNRIWSALPEPGQHHQLLGWARRKHVVVAESEAQGILALTRDRSVRVRILAVSISTEFKGGIKLTAIRPPR